MRSFMVVAILALSAGSSWASDSDWAPRTQDQLYRVREQTEHDQKMEAKKHRRAEEKRVKAEAEAKRRQAYQDCVAARQAKPELTCSD